MFLDSHVPKDFIDNESLVEFRHNSTQRRGENTKDTLVIKQIAHLNRTKLLKKKKKSMSELRFDGQVALVTGAGT